MINIHLEEMKTLKVTYDYSEGKPEDIKLGYGLRKEDDGHYNFTFAVKCCDDFGEGHIRTIEVVMLARMAVDGDEDDHVEVETMVKNTAASILFPYVRTLISTLTTNDTKGKMIILPTVNMASVIKDIDENLK